MANHHGSMKVAVAGAPVGRVIHKYAIDIRKGFFSLAVPAGSKVLDIAEQDGDMFVWIEKPNIDDQYQSRDFEVFGTGHVMESKERIFLKTVHHSSGLVLHYYEVI